MNKCFPYLGTFAVTSPFGSRGSSESYVSKYHYGIDLVGKSSKTIVSCTGGTVQKVNTNSSASYGKYVFVTNNDGTGCIYAHLSSVSVSKGQKVSCKTELGIEGSTGHSTGSHLHFGITSSSTYDSAVTNKSNWINPAIWFGINNYNGGQIKGEIFNGQGTITGYANGVTSTDSGVTQISNVNDETQYASYSSNTSSVFSDIIPSGQFYKVDNLNGTTGDWLFGRKYRVLIDIGNNKALDVSDLRCSFEIVKSSYFNAQQSVVTIYNLNPTDENLLIQEGQRIVIEAGYYGSQYGKIFEGNVIQPLRSKENGVDYKLTLVSMDSDRYITYGLVGVALVAQQSSRDAINACATKATYPVKTGVITTSKITYPRGKVMFGSPTTFLNQIAKSENAQYYNSDGKVNIISASDLADNEIFSFGPESGLIGTPVQSQYGITCKVLLNPRLKVNSLFHIDNTKIENYRYTQGEVVRSLDSQGIYRVVKITYIGDTRGQDWYCEVEAISQAGMLPGMSAGNDIYIY